MTATAGARAGAITLCLLAVLALFAIAPAGASAACAAASARAYQASTTDLASATLCLVNEERAQRGLSRLRPNSKLSLAARRHARDMVVRQYFAHESLDGRSFLDRIRRTGYLRGARSWGAGENIAWGSGIYATPESIVEAWMESPGHRRNILNRRYRELGVAATFGAPVGNLGDAATYAHEFGLRR